VVVFVGGGGGSFFVCVQMCVCESILATGRAKKNFKSSLAKDSSEST
jgi:hypothetical protein